MMLGNDSGELLLQYFPAIRWFEISHTSNLETFCFLINYKYYYYYYKMKFFALISIESHAICMFRFTLFATPSSHIYS